MKITNGVLILLISIHLVNIFEGSFNCWDFWLNAISTFIIGFTLSKVIEGIIKEENNK